MKNVTISLDETVARWARVWAARENISVSRLLAELLEEKMRQEEDYETQMEKYLSRPAEALKSQGGYSSREELHDRAGLR